MNGSVLSFRRLVSSLFCQSDGKVLIWKKLSLSLSGKDVQSGLVGAVLTYEGVEPSGNRYCKRYMQAISSTALIIANIQKNGLVVADKSQLTTYIQIGARMSDSNIRLAQNK